MLGWIAYQPHGLPRVRHRVEVLGGMVLCRVEIRGPLTGLLRLFLRREEGILRQAGVREGVWPQELPEPLRLDLAAVDAAPLRRALLPTLLEKALRQKRMLPKTASVLLTAEGTSLSVYWAAQLLSQRVRCLHLDTGYGQGALEEWLLQRYGLACGGAAPELEVTLRREGPTSALLLGENCLCQRIDYILPPALAGQIPGGREGEQLLAALYRQGRLRPSDISVERIHFGA